MVKCKEMCYSFKNLDLLGKPVEWEINSKHTKNSIRYKTWPGFIITILWIFLGVSYLIFLLFRMQNGLEDKFYHNLAINSFKDGQEQFNLTATNFMPTMAIEFLNHVEENIEYLNKHDINVLEGETISLTKLNQFITIELRLMY